MGSLKLCTQQMAMSFTMRLVSQVRYMNSSKSNSYIWSLVGPTLEGTPSMHISWWNIVGACAGCRSVESHLFMEGGLVCEWQVATSSCSEGSPSAKHVRTHSRVDMNFAGSSQKLNEAVLNKLLTFWIGDIWQESPLPYPRMIIFDILARHGFAGPVLSLRNETCLVQVESRVLTYLAHMYWKDWIYIY